MPVANQSVQFGDGAFCLLLGISNFHAPDFVDRPLPQATWDAEDLREVLCGRLGWRPENITALAGEVTLQQIIDAFSSFYRRIQSAEHASTFLMYLSTHGHLYEDHRKNLQACLLASDTDVSNSATIFDTALTRQRLGTYIGSMDVSSKVIIADACYSVSATLSDDFKGSEAYAETSAAVLASSPGLSFAKPADRHSLSTANLLEVLEKASGPVKLLSTADQLDEKLWKLNVSDFRAGVLIGFAGPKITIVALTGEEIHQITQQQIAEVIQPASRLPYRKERYVQRLELENHFNSFLSSKKSGDVYAIVGAAGSGKTTTSLYLAESASAAGYPVAWISPAEISGRDDPKQIFARRLQSVRPGITAESILSAILPEKPLILILDAINEWDVDSAQTASICRGLLDLPPDKVRLVATCRDNSWDNVRPIFASRIFGRKEDGIASAQLGAFDESEAAQARELYHVQVRIDVPELAQQPLFLRIISDTLAASGKKEVPKFLSVSQVLADYVQLKVAEAAKSGNEPPGQIYEKVLAIIRGMFLRRVESLATPDFLEAATEATGLALIDCGLFRRLGSRIVVEAQTIHEYLLSRILPVDPIADVESIGELVKQYNAWSGAAMFRIAEMEDTARVLQILQRLDSEHSIMPIFLLPRLPRLSEYREFYFKYLQQRNHVWMSLKRLQFVLERDLDGDWSFCMHVARALFSSLHYYEWERKRWVDLDWDAFRRRLEYVDHRGGPGRFLFDVMERRPREGSRALFQEWLPDSTCLEGGLNATIAEVGITYLCAFGKRYPAEVAAELDAFLHSDAAAASGAWQQIVREMASAAPRVIAGCAQSWVEQQGPAFSAGMDALFALPIAEFDFIRGEVDRLISARMPPVNVAADLLGTLLRFGDLRALSYVESHVERGATMRTVIVQAIADYLPGDGSQALPLIQRILQFQDEAPAPVEALVTFFSRRIDAAPEAGMAFLREALKRFPSLINSIGSRVASAKAHPAITAFIEEQLATNTNAGLFESYSDYIRRIRKLESRDVPWLRRWAGSNHFVYELVIYLADSVIPFDDAFDIVLIMDGAGNCGWTDLTRFVKTREQIDALHEFARKAAGHPQFGNLTPLAQVWFQTLASGANVEQAGQAVNDAFDKSMDSQ